MQTNLLFEMKWLPLENSQDKALKTYLIRYYTKFIQTNKEKKPWKRTGEMSQRKIPLLYKQAQGPELESQNPNKSQA